VFCWTDLWHGLTMSDIRAIEEKTKLELDEVWYSSFLHNPHTKSKVKVNRI